MSILRYYDAISNEWFWNSKKKKEEVFKYEYEADFLISKDRESSPDAEYAEKADNLFWLIRGEDKRDSVIENLCGYLSMYMEEREDEIPSYIKYMWSLYNNEDKVDMRYIKKHLGHKDLIVEPYVIKTNKDGNFLKMDVKELSDMIAYENGEMEYLNDTPLHKQLTSEVFKLYHTWLNEYNSLADAVYKKLKKVK